MRRIASGQFIAVMTAIVWFAMVHHASAAMLTLTNPSFESVIKNSVSVTIADGGFELFTTAGVVVPGWTISNNTGTNGGIFNPGPASTPGGNVAHGNNAAFLRNNFAIRQTLTDTLAINTMYTLTVVVQDRYDTLFAGYFVRLIAVGADTPVLNQITSIGGPLIGDGGSLLLTVLFDSTGASADRIGKPLRIEFSANDADIGTGRQTLFDDVKLDATLITPPPPPPSEIPEPASAMLLFIMTGAMLRRNIQRHARRA